LAGIARYLKEPEGRKEAGHGGKDSEVEERDADSQKAQTDGMVILPKCAHDRNVCPSLRFFLSKITTSSFLKSNGPALDNAAENKVRLIKGKRIKWIKEGFPCREEKRGCAPLPC